MSKLLVIGENEYKLQYKMEASLFGDCVTNIVNFVINIEAAKNAGDLKKMLNGIANIPQVALTLFYAGLLETHGGYSGGDGKVPNIDAAKRLLATYMEEHKGDSSGNFYGVMQMCVEQMNEDGFVGLLGLNYMLENQEKEKKSNK